MLMTVTATKEHIKTAAPKTDGNVFHNDIAEKLPLEWNEYTVTSMKTSLYWVKKQWYVD